MDGDRRRAAADRSPGGRRVERRPSLILISRTVTQWPGPAGRQTARRPAPTDRSPVLTAPVSAVPTLFATVRAPLEAVLTGSNGPGRARTVANRAGTALMGVVRTGLQMVVPRAPRAASSRRTGDGWLAALRIASADPGWSLMLVAEL